MALSRRRPSQLASYGRRWWIQQHHLTSGPRRRMREVGGVTASGTSLVRANWRFGERYTTARSEGDERFSVAIENTPSFPAVMHGVCPSAAWLLPLCVVTLKVFLYLRRVNETSCWYWPWHWHYRRGYASVAMRTLMNSVTWCRTVSKTHRSKQQLHQTWGSYMCGHKISEWRL